MCGALAPEGKFLKNRPTTDHGAERSRDLIVARAKPGRRTCIFVHGAGCFVKSSRINANVGFSGAENRPNVRFNGVVHPP